MNREIKFRIWDYRYNEFRYWGFGENDMFKGIPTGGDMSIEYCKENSQQYNGLKDRHGNERCEGDIIRRFTGYTFVEERKWFRLGEQNAAQAFGYDFHKDDEIIGNVHQHPELLKTPATA